MGQTNKYELTIILVKDNKDMGFPVAFFLSNRKDHAIQEVYLEALKEKVGDAVQPEFLMTDDVAKYYNAWVKKMGNTPRRLLCTWHIIKNWTIQGRAKLKNDENKRSVKGDLKKILTAGTEENFTKLSADYFKKLEESNESAFLSYLKTCYFQSADRIRMWAYCYRQNAGINTNMALESLNKYLKYNILQGNARTSIETLLDTMDEIIREKMWNMVASVERPTTSSYREKETTKAHRKAEDMMQTRQVIISGPGKYRVPSSQAGEFFDVCFNNLTFCDCLGTICRVCEICVHFYSCTCIENAVRNNICKHIHLTALFEKTRHNVNISGLGAAAIEETMATEGAGESNGGRSPFVINMPSLNQQKRSEVIEEFIQGEEKGGEDTTEEELIKLKTEELRNVMSRLDNKVHLQFLDDALETARKLLEVPNIGDISRKRKMERQTYFPKKKRSE